MKHEALKLWKVKSAALLTAVLFVACAAASTREAGGAGGQARQQQATGPAPARPQVTLDTTYLPTTGRRIAVAGGAMGARNFQAALEQARPGDVLALEAGATFTGNFTLPKKAGAGGWIIIRSSAQDAELPRPGARMSPAHAARLPKLVSPNADPVITTAPGANHFRFIAVEFAVSPDVPTNYDLIRLGSHTQSSLAEVPHDLIIDRCYIHGHGGGNLRRGVALNSARTAVIDSHISECHEVGADSQAIAGWNGPGPFKIVNNYLEGAGENVLFGGADPQIEGLVPSDIEFQRNHCVKPLTWKKGHPTYAGKPWGIKNLFELKNARRVLIDGNLFENNWVHAQDGFAILFTIRNQDGGSPWSVVEDVTFTNNVLRRSAAAINILGRDNNHPSEQAKRITISNNLFYEIGGAEWGRNGRFLQLNETIDVIVDHNTVFHTGNIITAHGKPNERFVFTNNLLAHNEYGVIGADVGPGNATLNRYFPSSVFKKNALAGGKGSLYPADNFFPASLGEARINTQAPMDYRLDQSSPFKNAGTDGRDIGCDLGALKAATGSLLEPRPSVGTPSN